LALLAAAWAGLTLAAGVVAPAAAVPWPPLLYVVAFGAVTAATLTAAAVAPTVGPRALAAVLAGALGALGGLAAFGEALPAALQAVAVTFVLLVSGATLGGAVGGRVEDAGHLLPVVVVSLLVDAFSVFHSAGPTAAVAERPALIALVALPFPVLGTGDYAPVLGVGDVVFAALYVAASRKVGLGVRRTIAALAVGLLATMIGVLVTALALPALVGMGAAVLVAHPAAWRLPAQDRRKAIAIMIALAVAVVVLLLRD
jgi:hypothetical protein